MSSDISSDDIKPDTETTTEKQADDQSNDQSDTTQLNESKIVCKKCSCLILRSNQAKLVQKKIELPLVSTRKDEESAREVLDDHLLVDSIYTYENMGFSNTVEGIKYLVCAECEYGPLGCMNNSDKKSFLALDRVLQEKD